MQSFQHIKSPQAGEASARHRGGGVCVAVAWPRFDFVVVLGAMMQMWIACDVRQMVSLCDGCEKPTNVVYYA